MAKRWVLQCFFVVIILSIICCIVQIVKHVSESFHIMVSMKSLNGVPGYGFGSFRFQEPTGTEPDTNTGISHNTGVFDDVDNF